MSLKSIYIPDSGDKSVRASQDAKADMNIKLGRTLQPDPQTETTLCKHIAVRDTSIF